MKNSPFASFVSGIPPEKRAAAFFFAFPIVFLPVLEFVARHGFGNAFSPFSGEFGSFVLTYAWLLSLLGFCVAVFGRYGFWTVSFVLVLLASVHAGKLETLSEPLYPADVVTHASHAGDLAGFSAGIPGIVPIVGLLFALAVGWVGYAANAGNAWPRKKRGGVFAATLLLNALLVTNGFGTLVAVQSVSGLTPERYSWRQMENYEGNGFLAGFFTNLWALSVREPEGYSEAGAENALAGLPAAAAWTGSEPKPDVVLVLSESFWDPKNLPNVSFDPDPTPNFSALRSKFPGGTLISPTFGGKTALVEFELLTANSVSRLPEGTIPYQQYVRSPLPSVAWEFKDAGYSTVAVHPYRKGFFNRAGAYPFLGFDAFVAEEDMPKARKKGPFVSDETFADEVLRQLPESGPGKPAFVFGVSMENHFSYEGEKYESLGTAVSGSGLSPKELRILENYAEGIRDADAALGKMVRKLESSERPTLLAFFGDHLWILGERYETYRTTGYLPSADESEWTEADRLKMRAPPFLIWWNPAFERTYGKPETGAGRSVRATFFGLSVLKAAGIEPKNPYLRFAESVSGCFDDASVRLVENAGSGTCGGALRKWEWTQYSTMFGKNR